MEEQRKNSYDPNEDIVDRMWKRSKNSINLVIVVCNILVFLAVTLTGGTESSRHMMDCGAAYAPLIESGEYYRLFTSMFLHFGIQHLINNMLLLFVPWGLPGTRSWKDPLSGHLSGWRTCRKSVLVSA